MDDPHAHLVVGELLQRCLHGFHATLHVGLDDEVQILHFARLDLAEQILQRHLAHGGVGFGLLLGLALLHQFTSQLFVGHGVEGGAGRGRLTQTRDLHGHGGACGGDFLPLVADHGAHTTHAGTGDDDVALMQRAVLHQEGGHGAAPLVQPRLNDRALCGAVGVGLQLAHLGGEGEHFQQVLHAHAGFGGDGAHNGVAAPVLAHQAVLRELLLDALGVGLGFIHFVDGHDNGDACRLGVVNGLNRLGHNAVVRGHHQNGDVRDHGAAGAHGGEGLVTRGIQEGDGLAVYHHLVSADVLGNAAGLAAGHMGVADVVQQTGLAVVNVTHDHHHGGAGHQILGLVLVVVNELFLDGDHHFLFHLAAHFLGDDGGGIIIDHLAQGGHDAVFHQALDHLCAGFLHAACQLTHADLVGDLHGNGGLLDDLQLQAAQTVCLLLLALVADEIVVPPLLAVAELLPALGMLLIAAPARTAVGHVLQLLVVLGEIDVGSLAGIHHLGLGHPAHRLGGLLMGRLRLRLFLGRLRLGGGRDPGGLLLRFSLLFRDRLRLLVGGGLHALRKDHVNAGHRVVLGQILEYQRQLAILQHLHMIFWGLRILGQDLRDLLGGQAEVLCHLMHPVFVPDISQIKPPPSL